MKTAELRNLTDKELCDELSSLRKRMYRIRESMVVESASDLKEYRMSKKDIARIMTVLRERKSASKK